MFSVIHLLKSSSLHKSVQTNSSLVIAGAQVGRRGGHCSGNSFWSEESILNCIMMVAQLVTTLKLIELYHFFLVLGIEPRTLDILNTHCTPEPFALSLR